MTPVRHAAVAVVREELDPLPRRPPRVHARLRPGRDLQHRVPIRDVVVRGQHLGNTEFQMVEVDVRAATVRRQKRAPKILRVKRSGAADAGLISRRTHGAPDLGEQYARRLADRTVTIGGALDEVAQFDIGTGELGHTHAGAHATLR